MFAIPRVGYGSPHHALNVTLSNLGKVGSDNANGLQGPEPTSSRQNIASPAQTSDPRLLSPSLPGLLAASNDLDEPLTVKGEINLEPDNDYPDELAGRADLNLLIGEDGSVRWIGVEYSELESTVLQPIVDKFMKAQFSRPTVAGIPRLAMIRIEVVIGAATAQTE